MEREEEELGEYLRIAEQGPTQTTEHSTLFLGGNIEDFKFFG